MMLPSRVHNVGRRTSYVRQEATGSRDESTAGLESRAPTHEMPDLQRINFFFHSGSLIIQEVGPIVLTQCQIFSRFRSYTPPRCLSGRYELCEAFLVGDGDHGKCYGKQNPPLPIKRCTLSRARIRNGLHEHLRRFLEVLFLTNTGNDYCKSGDL